MKRALMLTGAIPVLAATACTSAGGPSVTSLHESPAAGLFKTVVNRPRPPKVAEPGEAVPASAVQRLTAIADSVASEDGGHPVAWATAVVTTRAKALTSATPGDFVAGDEKTVVYLITMKGSFVDYGFSGPPGSHAPRGRYVSLVLSAKTFEGTDGGISNKPPPVAPASLGPVTHLHVHPSPVKRS